MVTLKAVATYIYQRYYRDFGVRIDEMKLHKLLYFAQRECIVQTGEPMFSEQFEAGKYGPLMPIVREWYQDGTLDTYCACDGIDQYQLVFEKIFSHYAKKSAWSLVSLTHGEQSWVKARKGCSQYDSTTHKMELTDIKKDAERIGTRRFLLARYKEFINAKTL